MSTHIDTVVKSTVDRSTAQTFSRGLQLIEVLAASGGPMTAQDLAAALGVSRTIVYRLLRTLEEHHILNPDLPDGKFGLGLGLLSLSRSVNRNLREAALPILRELAHETNATAFVGVREGDEIVCMVSVEPETAFAAIRYREGLRNPLSSGASGLAIMSTFPPGPGDSPALKEARSLGYAHSEQTLEPNASAISAPIVHASLDLRACVTVIFPFPKLPEIGRPAMKVLEAAVRIAENATL